MEKAHKGPSAEDEGYSYFLKNGPLLGPHICKKCGVDFGWWSAKDYCDDCLPPGPVIFNLPVRFKNEKST